MEFPVVVLSLIVLYLAGSLPSLQRDDWYSRWVNGLRSSIDSKKHPVGRLFVSLALPVFGVVLFGLIFANSLFGLPWLVLNILLLLYSFGRGDLDEQIGTYQVALHRNDAQAAYHEAAVFNLNHHEGLAENWGELHRETLSAISYRYFEHYFAVIFWYFLLGVPGALLYRLSELHADMALDEEREKPLAKRWLWLMEWLPTRLMGVALAIFGNFSECMHHWQQTLFDRQQPTAAVLDGYVQGAMSSVGDERPEVLRVKQVRAVQALYSRSLLLVVSLIAALVIFV